MYTFLQLATFAVIATIALGFQANRIQTRVFRTQRSSLSMHNVRVINARANTDGTIEVPQDKIILDVAEENAVSIPYSCRAGSCSSCVGKMISGEVDQTGNIFLSDGQIDAGYVLTCVAMPRSDCEVRVGPDVEEEFYSDFPDAVASM